jgi:hypothetical protein
MLNNEINTDSFFGHMYLQLMVRPEDSSGNLIQLLWYDEEFGPLMEIYSVTFEIQNNDPLNPAPTLHQEFYQEGSGTDHFTDRRYGVETLPNGWYRLWASCYYGYDYGASSKASFRMGIIFPEAGFGFPAVMLGVEGRSNRSGTFDERPPYPELDTWTAGAGVNSGLAHNIDVRDHLNWTSPTNDMTMEQEFTVRSTVDADWIEEDTLYYTDHFLYANLYAGPEDQRDISDSNTVLPTPGYVQHGPGITRTDQLNFNANKFQDNQALYSPGGDTISEGDVVNVTWQVEDGRALMYRSGTLISDVAWTSPIDSGVGDNSGDIVQIQFEDMTRPGSQGFGLPRFPNQEAHYHHLLFVGDEGDNDYDASQTAGSAVRVLEKLNRHSEAKGAAITKTADAGLFFAGPVSSVTMLHLQGYDLVAWGTRVSDGAVGPITGLQADSTTGVVELGDSYTNVFIGAPYSARYKSGRLAYAGQGGTSMEQPKRVSGLGVLLQDTHRNAVRFGSDFSNLRSMPIVSKGLIQPANQIYADYDDVMFTFPGLWDTDSRVVIQVDAPYPATFTGLVYGVETETRGGRNTKGRSRSTVKRRGRGR